MPDLFPFRVEWIQAFLLVFTRISATLAFLPIFGGQGSPSQLKIGLAALMSIVVFPMVDTRGVNMDVDVMSMAMVILGEAMIGLLTGFLVNMVFAAVQLAGSIIDFQVGFGIVNVVDPVTNAQVSVTAQLLNITAMLLFLAFNAHHLVLMGLADSFRIIPPGGFHAGSGIGEMLMQLMSGVFNSAAQIAAPVTVTLLILQTAMGLVARTVPQINIFIVGFPITITIGLLTIAFCLPAFSLYMNKMFIGMVAQMDQLYAIIH